MIYAIHIQSLLAPFIVGVFEVTIYEDIDDFYYSPIKGDKKPLRMTQPRPTGQVKVLCERPYEWKHPGIAAVYWVDEGEDSSIYDNPYVIFPSFSILIKIPIEDYRKLDRNPMIGEGFIAGMIYAQYKTIDAVQRAEAQLAEKRSR